jgi:hypothetical protein
VKLDWKRPAAQIPGGSALSGESCEHRFAPRIRRSSYWVRSSLITDTSVVCSNCGQPVNDSRADGR